MCTKNICLLLLSCIISSTLHGAPQSIITGTILDPQSTFNTPYLLAITPDGNTAYVTNNGNATVSIVDLTQNPATVSDPLATLYGPYGVTIASNGRTGYIVNQTGSTVSIMSITSVFSPNDFQGCKTQNVFLTQTDSINILTWSAPTNGNPPVSYTLTNANGFIATVPANGPLQYTVHNCKPNATYTIVANDQYGNVSDPISTTVTAFCS